MSELQGLRLSVAEWLALSEGQIPAPIESRVMENVSPDLECSQQEFTDLIGAMLRPGDLDHLEIHSELPEAALPEQMRRPVGES